MGHVVKAKVWANPDPVAVARWLLGKFLVRELESGQVVARMITETEAYFGEADRACHARAGRTRRTEVLYARGGVWYVYLCYGIHEMLNLVTGPENEPAAVLIRGVEGIAGPGRVTKQLAIGRELNGVRAERASGLWIEDRGVTIPDERMEITPRIGVDYAGPEWAGKLWRFVLRSENAEREKSSNLQAPEKIQTSNGRKGR